jgi:hypothetical protein
MSALEHVVLALPFRGTWLTRNSPPRRGPSHGTHLFATTYAVDFIAVQGRRTATTRDRRSLLSTEPVERFFAFGQAILAPAAGRVLSVHDSEADHEARRSRLALVPYMLTQAARARAGAAGLAGNHVILELDDRRAYVVLAPCARARCRWGRASWSPPARSSGVRQFGQLHAASPARSGHGRDRPVQRSWPTDVLSAVSAVASIRWARSRRSSRVCPVSRRSSHRCRAASTSMAGRQPEPLPLASLPLFA